MADITLVELNLQGAESEIHLPFSGSITKSRDESDADKSEESGSRFADEDSSGGKTKLFGALVGLAFVVIIAALAKRRFGGDDGGVDIETADEESDVMTVADE